MLGNVHASSGVILSGTVITGNILLSHNPDISSMALFTGACMLGSVFADIDNRKSTLGRKARFIPFVRFFQGGLDHRKFLTHTPLFPIITSLFMLVYGRLSCPLNTALIYGWLSGYLLHLTIDTLTSRGIRWLYPFSRKYFSLKKTSHSAFINFVDMVFFSLMMGIPFFTITHI